MEKRFARPATRWVFLLVVWLVGASLAMGVAKYALAEYYVHSSRPEDWFRAARLEPGNAEYWYRLGRLRHLDFEHGDLQQAILYYRRAVEIAPCLTDAWMDLGSVYEMTGQSGLARTALEKAKECYPGSAEAAWRYGNFLLRQGRTAEAFAEIHRAVAGDPDLLALAVSRTWRATGQIEPILNQVLPADSRAYLVALDSLVAEHEVQPALVVWSRLVALNRPVELRRAFPLLRELMAQDRIEDASQVWRQALVASGNQPPAGSELVTDRGFEQEETNGGFGWWLQPVAGAAYDFDTETVHSGARSLSVAFDGKENIDFRHAMQYVPVSPHTRYRFTAYLRTDGITTDSGIRFQIYDPRHTEEVSLLTPALLGRQPWTLQEAEFTTGPHTRLLGIALRRLASTKFDNKLGGIVWVDDVSLVPALGTKSQSP